MALYSSSSKPSFDTPHYADLRRENQFARSLEFLVREFAPIIAAAKNEPTKRIIRGKETHHGGTWNREGRNRVFNGVLPEGRLEPWRRKKEEEEEEDRNVVAVLRSTSSRRFPMLLPGPTSHHNLHSHFPSSYTYILYIYIYIYRLFPQEKPMSSIFIIFYFNNIKILGLLSKMKSMS